MLGLYIAIAAAAAMQDGSALDRAEPEDEAICISVAHYWRGDNEDARRIATIPVPQSYRDDFFGTPCARWQLQEESLIDWHLAFGDEASTSAALAFLEADLVRGAPILAAFPRDAERAWQDAERELRAAAPGLAAQGTARARAERGLRQSRGFRRLVPLVEAHSNYVFLATEYLRAAEFFGSPALFARAQAFFIPAQEGLRILYRGVATTDGGEDAGLAAFLSLSDWHMVDMRDVEMRLAIAKARLSGDPADVDVAAALMDSRYEPLMGEAAHHAADHGGAICGVPEVAGEERDFEDNRVRAIRMACQERRYFEWRVIDFWRNQAQLDMLMAADPVRYGQRLGASQQSGSDYVRNAADAQVPAQYWPRVPNFERAVLLLERARTDRPVGRNRPIVDNLVALHVARADLFVRLRDRPGMPRAAQYEGDALRDLTAAERLAPPYAAPGRFRQIARRYLAIRAAILARAGEGRGGSYGNGPENARMHVYLRQTLDDLGRIAVGED